MTIHPAHKVSFSELAASLRAAEDQRLVTRRLGPDGLELFTYTKHCVYEQAWTPASIVARGLILDPAARRIVATPFPKFFNLGERDGAAPDLSFEVTEKLDGSLIIIYHHDGAWRTATKGAFDSSQAVWALEYLTGIDLSRLAPGTTYLAEATYPENRIVVPHTEARLRLLAAYHGDGAEMPFAEIVSAGQATGLGSVARRPFGSLAELMAHTQSLPKHEEGFVLRFADGLRLKVKGAEYRRIHALISGLSPLAVWEAMAAGGDLTAIRRELPEEIWGDFDNIVEVLAARKSTLVDRIEAEAASVAHLSDKELGLSLAALDPETRGFVFEVRKHAPDWIKGRARQKLFERIRPEANVLPGYKPSFMMSRVQEESLG